MYELQEIKIHGKTYPAVFNVVALKEVGERYGGIKELGEKLKGDYAKAITAASWVIALLIKQGTDLRNFEEGKSDLAPTQDQIELLMSPGEMAKQQGTIIEIINAGMNMGSGDAPAEEEEIDEVLEAVLKTKNGEGAKE